MAYSLGAVKPWVKAAAEEVGPKFGIRTIYGWAPGKYEHPKGLALDFMISNLSNGKAVGDALSAYLLANAKRLGIKYVIWNKRSWNPSRNTWAAYSGDSDHTDHVHASFEDKVPVGGPVIGGPDWTGLQTEKTGLSNPLDVFKEFGPIFRWVSDSHNWLRVLYVVVGAALVIGVIAIVVKGSAVSTAAGVVKDAVSNGT